MDYKDQQFWLMHGECLERMKEIPSKSTDLVLTDPPYGTTGVACKNLNRKFIGIENNEEVFKVAKKRILDA